MMISTPMVITRYDTRKRRTVDFIGWSVALFLTIALGVIVFARKGSSLPWFTNVTLGATIFVLPIIWVKSYQKYIRLQEVFRILPDSDERLKEVVADAFQSVIMVLGASTYVACMLFQGIGWAGAELARLNH